MIQDQLVHVCTVGMWTNKGSCRLEQLPVWLPAPDMVVVGEYSGQMLIVYLPVCNQCGMDNGFEGEGIPGVSFLSERLVCIACRHVVIG